MFKHLRWRLTWIYIFMIVLPMVLLGAYMIFFQHQYVQNNLQAELKTQASLAACMVEDNIKEEFPGNLKGITGRINNNTKAQVALILDNGAVYGDFQTEELFFYKGQGWPEEILKAFNKGHGESVRFNSKLNSKIVYAASSFSSNNTIGVVCLAAPVKDRAIFSLSRIYFIVSLLALLLTVLVTRVVSKQLTEPVGQLTKFARRFSRGDFKYRAPISSRDEIGELAGTLNTMAETIEEKVKQIYEGKNKLETVLTNMISGVIFVNKDGIVELVNPAARKFTSFTENEMTTGLPYDIVLKNSGLLSAISKALEKGKVVEEEIKISQDKENELEVIVSPISDDSGYPSGVVVVLHDITQIRKLEKMRTEFVANVSHELKTPVTSIKGFTETLLDGAINEESTCREFVEIIDKESGRLQSLVEDLLELSKIESKQVNLEFETADVCKIASDVVTRLKGKVQNNGLKIKQKYPCYPVFAKVDRNLIEQVLVNLVDNAVKYNVRDGKIEIVINTEGNFVVVWVRDTGIGITPEDVDRVFERFFRVEKARSRILGGTGLGLSIVKHIVDAHGGIVGVNSKPEDGSDFFFTLPRVY
ncbi:MAG: cell wall metabolism sensor histidine kinase WalK [Clostridiales bacterium]|nr:cell wall metabolism sensor histidine kinase WalK [Clostridiales bacterium]MCF8021861.1 cell wall metabolism sensor histidine kinase WalK [Clostridiales bacterium]